MYIDLRAAKAYVGGLLATSGTQIATFLVQAVMTMMGMETNPPPTPNETAAIHVVAGILGFLAVYWTSNQKPKP